MCVTIAEAETGGWLGMPYWVQVIVGVAGVIIAVGGASKVLHAWGKTLKHAVANIQAIAKELTPNGGGSVKDKVNQAAADSNDALALTRTQGKRQLRHIRRLKRVEQTLATQGKTTTELENWLARCIAHFVKGDLSDSRLMREVEKYLSPGELDEFRAEGRRLAAERARLLPGHTDHNPS